MPAIPLSWSPAPWLPPTLFWPLAASVALSLVPGGKYALYPFRVFTTWAHECCHAGMARILGGQINRITLSPDTSGLTQYQLRKGRLRQALVTSAGYPGASVAGCALYALSQGKVGDPRLVLGGVGALLLASLLCWVRGAFGMLAVTGLGAGLIATARLAPAQWASYVLAWLAIQTGVSALLDSRELFRLSPRSRSDAEQMRALFWLPSAFWALSWVAFGLALTYWTVRRFTP